MPLLASYAKMNPSMWSQRFNYSIFVPCLLRNHSTSHERKQTFGWLLVNKFHSFMCQQLQEVHLSCVHQSLLGILQHTILDWITGTLVSRLLQVSFLLLLFSFSQTIVKKVNLARLSRHNLLQVGLSFKELIECKSCIQKM